MPGYGRAMTSRSGIGDRIRPWVLADFGVRLLDVEPYGGGLDPDAAVWRAVDDEAREWAVKWTRRDSRFGLRLSRSLAESGVVGVPGPRVASDGRPWSDHRGGRLSVTTWISGEDAFETGLDLAQWREFGALLRQVHDHELPGAEPGVTARRGIRRAGIHIKRRLGEIDELVAASGESTEPAILRFVARWPEARSRIRGLQDVAGRLKIARAPTERVTCHGDPHLGNVVLDDRGRPWLIDFDDAVRAPREVDLMLVHPGVLFGRPITEDERSAFDEGYGDLALDRDRLTRFACVRAVEDLVETAHELLARDTDTRADDLEVLFLGILSPTGLAGIVEQQQQQQHQQQSQSQQQLVPSPLQPLPGHALQPPRD